MKRGLWQKAEVNRSASVFLKRELWKGKNIRQYRKDLPVVTILLVAAAFFIFVMLERIGSTNDISFMYEHGALYAPAVLEGKEYYRLITAAFLHFGAAHLMNNMLGLYLIGERLERMVGKIRYLLISSMNLSKISAGSQMSDNQK
ncbi:MAG: rhomboid family intramembrane serine protease [Clostridiales bacterium]|nr:rhomboid family intramembrane serine protease [Clostridiales bacterium]